MDDARLREALQAADCRSEIPTPDPEQLKRNVRQLLQRHQRRRRAGTVAALLLLAGITQAWQWFYSGREETTLSTNSRIETGAGNEHVPAQTTEQMADQIHRLEALARIHALTAQKMITAELEDRDRAETKDAAATDDPFQIARDELDLVAFQIIYRADKLRQQSDPSANAMAMYRNVIELFPNTRSAVLARDRLAEFNEVPGEM